MKKSSHFQRNGFFIVIFSLAILHVLGNPIQKRAESSSTKSNEFKSAKNSSKTLDCNPVEYALENVTLFTSNYLKTDNATVYFTDFQRESDRIFVCPYQHIDSENIILNCTYKFVYQKHEFKILANKSALVHGAIIPPEEYKLKGQELLTCAPDDEDNDYPYYHDVPDTVPLRQVSIYVGIIGSFISIFALCAHLIIFCLVPALRNLPGYNLASLSVAFMLGYSFALIGQIPEVLGLSCIISGVLQLNFFLTAFFCTNVLAFDVWRTLKLATEKLAVGSQNTRKRQFIWYSLYAWGGPLVISTISVIVDNSDRFPDNVKPYYGANDTCWITNNIAKTIFFAAPAFTLIAVNGIFFIRSFIMIYCNTMKSKSDHSNQSVKLNYILYVRLGLMMGLTWLMGAIALIFSSAVLWLISDLLNSLQGLFLFLLFTCTKKVLKVLRERAGSSRQNVSVKETTVSSNNFTSSSKKTVSGKETTISQISNNFTSFSQKGSSDNITTPNSNP